jgi:hypothetical protein
METQAEKGKIGVRSARRWRLVATLAAGIAVGTTIAASPAAGHVGGTVEHLWSHLMPLSDARYYTKGQVNAYSSARSAHRSNGPASAPAGPAFTTVVTQNVGRGFYVFLAKTVIITSSSTGSDCILTYDIGGGEVEADRSNQAPFNSSVTARTTHNLQRLLQFGNTRATLRLKCRAGTTWSSTNSSIVAMRVASALDQEVNG